MAGTKFLIEFTCPMAPGDVLTVTALVRDFKLAYPHCEIDVKSPFMDSIWRHNPYLTTLSARDPAVRIVPYVYLEEMKQSQSGTRLHYVTAPHRAFQRLTGVRVPCRFPKGDLHLTDEEKARPRISGRYWIVVPGGKTDITCKIWPKEKWQSLVDQLRPWGLRFAQEGCLKPMHMHPPLQNALNLVGLTTQRDLMVNIYHAEGVICGVTYQMHLAAALDKPCVVIAGGREEAHWEHYHNGGNFGPDCAPVKVPHRFLHTIGSLPCCKVHGCWMRRVVPLRDNRPMYDKDLCHQPVRQPDREPVPQCLAMIEPSHVAEAVMSYYTDGTLPPPVVEKHA